jgi:hypothetical protein
VRLAVFSLGFLLLGCSSPETPSETTAAQTLLTECLEAWKSGASIESMRQEQPPVYVVDDQWQNGKLLTHYDVLDDVGVIGQTTRFDVELVVAGRRDRVQYAVTTIPAYTMSRID